MKIKFLHKSLLKIAVNEVWNYANIETDNVQTEVVQLEMTLRILRCDCWQLVLDTIKG